MKLHQFDNKKYLNNSVVQFPFKQSSTFPSTCWVLAIFGDFLSPRIQQSCCMCHIWSFSVRNIRQNMPGCFFPHENTDTFDSLYSTWKVHGMRHVPYILVCIDPGPLAIYLDIKVTGARCWPQIIFSIHKNAGIIISGGSSLHSELNSESR